MTNILELREKVAVDIRSLLLSTPIGLTAKQLRDDYASFVGSTLPYRELGYYGVEDMVKDMPDVVHVSWQAGQMILKAVVNEETKRIASLVSRQRLSDKAKKEQRRRRMGCSSSQRSVGSGRYYHRPDSQPFVPASTRNQVLELLKSYRSGLRLTQLEGAFLKRFGVQFEWRHLGFNSLYKVIDYLHGQSVVAMERYGSDYMVYLGRGHGQQQSWQGAQKPSQPWRSNSVSARDSQPQNKPQRDLGNMPLTHRFRGVSPIIRAVPHNDRREDEAHCIQGGQSPVESRVTCPDSSLHDLESDGSMESDDDDDTSNISQVMKKEIQQLLAAKPEGILASRLIQEYKAKYNKDLGLTELGYYSVLQFVGELQDIVRVERPSASDWLLFDARIQPKSKPPSPEKQHEEEQKELQANSKFDDEFKEELRWVLLHHKEGVFRSELAEVYQRLTGKVLDPVELGFKTMDGMLLSVMDKYLNLKYVGNGEMIVSGIEFPSDSLMSPPEIRPVEHSLLNPASVSVNTSAATSELPDDIVSYGTSYKPLPLGHLHPAVAEKEYIEVYVSNINNPSRFWLQLRGRETSMALEDLMESLDFYKTKAGERYKMPESMIVVGQVCAVIFPEDENWHRGVIVGIKDLDFVQVYYVDYGNTCTVPKTSLCMLRRRYLRLPCQALQARLTDMTAPKTGWTVATMRRMLDLVGNKAVVAEVTDLKDYVLSVYLTDTNTDEDIHVNNVLCEEGYAVYAPDNPEEAQVNCKDLCFAL
ncbi:tudor domain-containing protein 5-like [Liolophura sinensis]|uniref:tudor domain-containing protein 5-like n=1 Tax=Liolophura sinensis TaxID=3198878 RepID=UPI00315896F2